MRGAGILPLPRFYIPHEPTRRSTLISSGRLSTAMPPSVILPRSIIIPASAVDAYFFREIAQFPTISRRGKGRNDVADMRAAYDALPEAMKDRLSVSKACTVAAAAPSASGCMATGRE